MVIGAKRLFSSLNPDEERFAKLLKSALSDEEYEAGMKLWQTFEDPFQEWAQRLKKHARTTIAAETEPAQFTGKLNR